MRILYDSKDRKHKSVFGTLKPNQRCTVSVWIPSSCCAHKAVFETDSGIKFDLHKTDTADSYDIFRGDIYFENTGLYFYFFRIEDKNGSYALYKEDFDSTNIGHGDMWQVSCIPEDFKTPEDFKGAVYYQIFPDRFFKSGECDLNGKLTPYTVHKNTDDSPNFAPNENGEILNNDFFGGNLKGIEEKLSYIKELGASIIYLNPIFKAFSNHRYDTCDYKRVDEMLGTNEDFKSLCNRAHSMGIKVILDGVFSHTGADSIYFDAKRRFGTGAMSCPGSPYKDWYNIKDDRSYESWWGIDTLPCVNELSQSYLDYILLSEDSVISYWLSMGCDGFRLDVADELPDEFIALLRNEVKKINPDAIVIGEVWEDASNKISYGTRRKYFTNAQLDSVMNYPFRSSIIDFCRENISAEVFCENILTILENYPKEAVDCLMTSLSTHDTPRIMTVLSGAPTDILRCDAASYKLSNAQIEKAYLRIYPAVFLMFFLPGCTSVYYGDETGEFAFGDPFNRGFFPWENIDCPLHNFYSRMAQIKNSFAVFKHGKLYINASENTLYMERCDDEQKLCAVLNMDTSPVKLLAKDILISHNATISENDVYINKYGFAVFR